MKKNKFTLQGILILSLLAASCQNMAENSLFGEPDSSDGQSDIVEYSVPDTSERIQEDMAADIARQYLAEIPGADSRAAANRVIESVNAICDSSGQAEQYVVNFTNDGGFVVLSASKDYFPVIAFSETGRYDMTLGNTLYSNELLREHLPIMQHSAGLEQDVKREIASQWTSLTAKKERVSLQVESRAYEDYGRPQAYYDSLQKWSRAQNVEMFRWVDYIQTQEYQNMSDQEKGQIIAKLHEYGNGNELFGFNSVIVLREEVKRGESVIYMKTEWNQQGNFNTLVPNDYPLGCTTIAAGQIMRFHEYPSDIPWLKMDNTYGNDYSASFLYDLALDLKVEFKKDGSSGDVKDVVTAFRNYGYSADLRDHDKSNYSSYISAGLPVFMSGIKSGIFSTKGHAWVCDGKDWGDSYLSIRIMSLDYSDYQYGIANQMYECWSKYELTGLNAMRYHMNWGWGGPNNGFYLDSNIKVTVNGEERNYSKSRKDIIITR